MPKFAELSVLGSNTKPLATMKAAALSMACAGVSGTPVRFVSGASGVICRGLHGAGALVSSAVWANPGIARKLGLASRAVKQ